MHPEKLFGELVPLGGGDIIPLLKTDLLIGRRESCDIVLRFPNVSAHHCQLKVVNGYWMIKDLESRNGVKINGARISEKCVVPGDEVAIAKHRYEMRYSPVDLGAIGPPPYEETSDVFQTPLLDRSGLTKPKRTEPRQG